MNTPNLHLTFPELEAAIARGYHHFFKIHPDGLMECLSNPNTFYELDDVILRFTQSSSKKATLYLIETRDGLYKGVHIDYWEHSSL
jgi:hypothetical protein